MTRRSPPRAHFPGKGISPRLAHRLVPVPQIRWPFVSLYRVRLRRSVGRSSALRKRALGRLSGCSGTKTFGFPGIDPRQWPSPARCLRRRRGGYDFFTASAKLSSRRTRSSGGREAKKRTRCGEKLRLPSLPIDLPVPFDASAKKDWRLCSRDLWGLRAS
jgi:hypothetical protein